MSGTQPVAFVPPTADRWPARKSLFGPNGTCAGCWYRWWRLRRRAHEAGRDGGNRAA